MPRKAREKSEYGFYHVRQVGGGSRPLFRDDADRAYFLDALKKAQARYGFRLHAYCLLADDEYHLVLDMNGADLSSVMKSLNIGYALHARCDEPLFRDRYRSRALATPEEVLAAMRGIHRPTDTHFNSFCHDDPDHPIALDWIATPDPARRDCIRTLPEARERLARIAREGSVDEASLLSDRACRNRLIHDFRLTTTLSLKELGELFGGLTESSVSKILNR